MNTIIIMNNATEQMLGARLNAQQQMFAAMAALRNAWLTRPGDIIVSAKPLSGELVDYICRTLGFPPRCFDVIGPELTSAGLATVSDEFLLSDAMVDALRSRLGSEPARWTLLPCYQTEGVARLGAQLGLPDSVGRRFAEQRGTDLLNRKSHFRQLAIGASLPIADGALVTSAGALSQAIRRFIAATGMVIVKRNNGAGGTGNIVVTTADAGPQPGAFETIVLASDIPVLADSLWSRMTTHPDDVLVVETYHPAACMFYVELYVGDDLAIDILNTGAIRVRAHDDPEARQLFWVGLELPADVPLAKCSEAMSLAARFTRLAADMGYRGHINIDAIISVDGQLIFNEANARWGGGTVLHSVAERLLGPQYARTHVVSSFREVRAPDLPQTLGTLERHNLLFDAERGEGIVVLASGHPLTRSIEAFVVARTRPGLRRLEGHLVEAMRLATGVAA